MIKNYKNFLNEEVGLRNISKFAKLHKTAEIYFHKDLDGVTSAIAMKEFLKNYYQINTVDCHIIQYGGLEYAIKHHQPENLSVLVDFAHGKPMFHIQSDHHDKQVGAKDTESTYFKPARSNVEIISGEISYNEIFTQGDIELIKTVDSANFLKHNIKPEDIHNAIFKYDKGISAEKNRFMMGFVVNRLLLAYKNKRITVKSLDGRRNHINRNILECLVLDSSASLYSMFNNIRHYINNAITSDKLGRLASPENITKNLEDYIGKMKNYRFIEDPDTGEVSEYDPSNRKHQFLSTKGAKIGKGVHFDEEYKIISQYGGGALFKPGSYDRYVPFKNFPESEFLCIVWPMGLIQVSCNPFREKKLKGINLGEIAKEVLAKHETLLKRYYISLDSIKKEFETSQDWKQMQKAEGDEYQGVGFKFSDLEAFYSDCVFTKKDSDIIRVDIEKDVKISEYMNKLYQDLSSDELNYLSNLKIPVWELIIRNSGGHPSITNISGLNFLKYNKKMLSIAYNTEKYVDVLKRIARELINELKNKIDIVNKGETVEYDTKGIEFTGHDTNESFDYQLVGSDGKPKSVSREDFIKAGSSKGMKTDRRSLMTIDPVGKKVIAKFESFEYEINEGWKENILVGLLSFIGVAGMGQNVKSNGDRETFKARTESVMRNKLKDGWTLDSIKVDTLWKEIQAKKPDTEVISYKLTLDKEQFFESGKFELSTIMKDTIMQSLDEIISSGGIITDIEITSSTDKQRLSQNLQNKLKSLGYTPDNQGLSKARANSVADYLQELGINNTLIGINNRWEQGEDEIDKSARYVSIEIIYLQSQGKKEAEDKMDFEVKKTYYLSKERKEKIKTADYKFKGGNKKVERKGPIKGKNRPKKYNTAKCSQPGIR